MLFVGVFAIVVPLAIAGYIIFLAGGTNPDREIRETTADMFMEKAK